MDFDQDYQFALDNDDLFPEPLTEEYVDAAAILSKPIPRLERQGNIFEEWLDERPLSPEGELPPLDEYYQRYARIFQEMEEGELTSDELIQNVHAWVDNGQLSSDLSSQGIPFEPTRQFSGMETGGEIAPEAVDSPDLSRMSGVGAATIAAGAGALLNAALKAKQGTEPEAQWYYSADSQQYGPLYESELKKKLQSGAFSGQGYVWREGMKDWITVSQSGLLPLQQAVRSAPVQQVTSPAADAERWYYIDTNQRTIGPVTGNDLVALITAGRLSAAVQVWTDGMSAWQSAATVGLVPVSGVNSVDPAVRQCPSCHRPLAAGSRFCGGCGTKL
ncbi:MAG: hypothetical protein AWM53_00643 [Candidatus Dichloromethanomonas elyunquensis]|nr:MAG: hypothetical protein AWM53_00643 [Candidatus Dichloromethanomonas elyunquensis]